MSTHSDFQAKLVGFDELEAFLAEASKKVGEGIIRKALKPAADRAMQAVINKTPIDKGTLIRSIQMSSTRKAYQLGYQIKGEYYGRFLEFGHKARHKIGTEEYRSRRGKVKTRSVSKTVGFVEATPFIRPAFNAIEQSLMDQMVSLMTAEILRLWTKHMKTKPAGAV